MGEEVFDSPVPWVADHIRRFEATGGRARPGMDDMLLTTRGRRSGKLRRTVLRYARDDGRYVVAASAAGADRHPAWYLNVVADPAVTVQVGDRSVPGLARVATAVERPRLWRLVTALAPSYQEYQDGTTREIPLVVIEMCRPVRRR